MIRRLALGLAIFAAACRENEEPPCEAELDADACSAASSDEQTCRWFMQHRITDIATCESTIVGACLELEGPGGTLGCGEAAIWGRDGGAEGILLVSTCGEEPPVGYTVCDPALSPVCSCVAESGDED